MILFATPNLLIWPLCDHLANVSYTCAQAFFLAGILAVYTKYILRGVYALCTHNKIRPGIANSPFADSTDKFPTPEKIDWVHFYLSSITLRE